MYKRLNEIQWLTPQSVDGTLWGRSLKQNNPSTQVHKRLYGTVAAAPAACDEGMVTKNFNSNLVQGPFKRL